MFGLYSKHPVLYKYKKEKVNDCWLAKLSPEDAIFFNCDLRYPDLCESYRGYVHCEMPLGDRPCIDQMAEKYVDFKSQYRSLQNDIVDIFWDQCQYLKTCYLDDLVNCNVPIEDDPGNITEDSALWHVMALCFVGLSDQITLGYSTVWDIEHPVVVTLVGGKVISVEGR